MFDGFVHVAATDNVQPFLHVIFVLEARRMPCAVRGEKPVQIELVKLAAAQIWLRSNESMA